MGHRLNVDNLSNGPSGRRAHRLLLPADTPTNELVRLNKIRWRIEHDYRELKHGLGLDHFEGRNLPRLAPPRHPGDRGTPIRNHPKAVSRPKSPRGSLSFYQLLIELQAAIFRMLTLLFYCQRAGPTQPSTTKPPQCGETRI